MIMTHKGASKSVTPGSSAWPEILAEARDLFHSPGRFAIRAYSEFMPPPYAGLKPYAPTALVLPAQGADEWAISEYEQTEQLQPGLQRVASHVLAELAALARGGSHRLSKTLLAGNPAWPDELATATATATATAMAMAMATATGTLTRQPAEPLVVCLPLCLSRTQDDKGNVRWTLFGTSHLGPARPTWHGLDSDPAGLVRFLNFTCGLKAGSIDELARAGVRILPRGDDLDFADWREALPHCGRALVLADHDNEWRDVRIVFTFRPFARLPASLRRAYLAHQVALVPSPASLVFFEHPRYRSLAHELPGAMQIPLLHLFGRTETPIGLRVAQSGWLDEQPSENATTHGHRVVPTVRRSHRWQRLERHADAESDPAWAEVFEDRVSTALFSTAPDDLGLYGKPMARNAQVWTEAYRLLLDGPNATGDEIAYATDRVRAGGRFGYRLFYPPMRAGARSLYWHLPLVARVGEGGEVAVLLSDGPLGMLTAERAGAASLVLQPCLLTRRGHTEAACLEDVPPGRHRFRAAHNVRRVLEFAELLGGRVPPSLARRLLDAPADLLLEDWLAELERTSPSGQLRRIVERRISPGPGPGAGSEPEPAPTPPRMHEVVHQPGPVATQELEPVAAFAPGDQEAPRSLTFAHTHTRGFEERLWTTIASLAMGKFRDKDNADVVLVNRGRSGGERGRATRRAPAHQRDNDLLAAHLRQLHNACVARHQMSGRAFVASQVFRWNTDFDFAWSAGWANNRAQAAERNVVVFIPGRNLRDVIVMADHYDTAYMEDLYDPARGGDRLRASAAGADDNHSATATLLAACDALLPLARAGALLHSVLLVHLTGEEFPADCLGARALVQALVEHSLVLQGEHGPIELGDLRARGVYVLDMVAHNNERHRDIFQIAPGEGAGSARLALVAHRANERWNQAVPLWNQEPHRRGRGRGARSSEAAPAIAEHLALRGEVRPEWDRRSSLYNTDGQIFSDAGVPVVLLMENYDIRRAGYHDTHDTLENIDLDYGAALAAIAIEAVAEAATTEL